MVFVIVGVVVATFVVAAAEGFELLVGGVAVVVFVGVLVGCEAFCVGVAA